MSVKQNYRKLLLVSTACAFFAACADTSISSPGAENIGTGGGDTGGGTTVVTYDVRPAAGCGDFADYDVTRGDVQLLACEVSGILDGTQTFQADGTYVLVGDVRVGLDRGLANAQAGGNAKADDGNGITQTIPAGTRFVGNSGADAIIVERGNRLEVNGTQTSPVIFTAWDDIAGNVDADTRGQWGGMIINGFAPINACDTAVPGGTDDCTKEGEGDTGVFGGDDASDDSGIYRFMQVNFAGFEFSTDNQLNGIALQGVGSGTVVDYVQVHNNLDDGIEFFGGTVDVRHAVVTGSGDDSFDMTDGWQGRGQYWLVIQNNSDADNGFEFDNFEDADDALPRSAPMVSNFTLIGDGSELTDQSNEGMRIREGAAGQYFNGIVANFGNTCLNIDDDSTFERFDGDNTAGDELLSFDSVILAGCLDGNFEDKDSDPELISNWFLNGSSNSNNVAAENSSLAGVFPGPIEESVVATNVNAIDPWFDTVDFVGAFGPTDVQIEPWTADWTRAGTINASTSECPTGTVETGEVINFRRVCRLNGDRVADVTLDNNSIYELDGLVRIGRDVRDEDGGDPATLTIEAGVIIFGNEGPDAIAVQRGSQIRVNGTAAQPVIMTSRADIEAGLERVDVTARGEWGGLIINGLAPINACDTAVPGGTAECQKEGEGDTGFFGGDNPEDDSGSISFLQLRYAGFEFSDDNQLNGIAFQGVGSGTEVQYVQVHNNLDDGIEFFGGTVDVRYALVTGAGDDSFDMTDGWQGRGQFWMVIQENSDADNGFEFDNFEDADDALPRSAPVVSNFTLIGDGPTDATDQSNEGMRVREGAAGQYYNGLVGNFNDTCLNIDDDSTFERFDGDTTTEGDELLSFTSTFLGDCRDGTFEDKDSDPELISTWFLGQAGNADVTGDTVFTDTYAAGAAVTGNAAYAPYDLNADDNWFVSTDYVGAVDPDAAEDDVWYVGWTYEPGWLND